LLTGCAINGRAPFNALLTHGFVVDGKGHKMSKSKGNVIAPQKIFDTLGADILRLWTATTDYSGELTISDEILKRVVESYRRIRNTLKFLLANISDFDVAKHSLPVNEWLEIDRYALAVTHTLQADITAAYAAYDFHTVTQKLQAFCSEDLGGFYLDILKDRLYTAGANSAARRSAQNALYHITQCLHRLMAPILSFTAEEVHEVLSGKDEASVFVGEWYVLPQLDSRSEFQNDWAYFTLESWKIIRECRNRVNKQLEDARKTGEIGSSLQAEVELYVSNDSSTSLSDFNLLHKLGDDLRLILITSSAVVHPVASLSEERIEVKSSAHTKCERCWHYRDDVGSDADHPTICGRCVSNLYGAGEARHYA
jgi:isoleucyl-tRNA synthetase